MSRAALLSPAPVGQHPNMGFCTISNLHDHSWPEVKLLFDRFQDLFIRQPPSLEGVDVHRQRMWQAYAIGHLDTAGTPAHKLASKCTDRVWVPAELRYKGDEYDYLCQGCVACKGPHTRLAQRQPHKCKDH